MRKLLFIILLFSLPIFSSQITAEIDSIYTSISANLGKYKCDSLDLNEYNFSTDGGILCKYVIGKFTYIRIELYGESGNEVVEYLSLNSDLIFIKTTRNQYNVPYYETEEFDEKKTKQYSWKYYIKMGKVVSSVIKDEGDNYGNDFNSQFKAYQEFLKIIK